MADYSLQHVCVSDLGLVFAEVWQSEGRLWVDEIVVDISLRRHKHQVTASAGQKETHTQTKSLHKGSDWYSKGAASRNV